MKDLTQGSVTKHLLTFSAFIAVSMLFQTMYFLADLYFVGRLGKEAIAAVGMSGNLMMVVLAITQMLGVGITTLVSHAVGRKDQARATLVFNQGFLLSLLVGAAFTVVAFALRGAYCHWLAADDVTAGLGIQYLNWFLPALMMQFVIIAMGAALRGSGVVQPTMIIQVLTVLVNIVLAPILTLGWGTGHAFGVAGAGMASFFAIGLGVILFWYYFMKMQSYLKLVVAEWKPIGEIWSGMIKVGLPAGGEFGLMAVYMSLVYWIIRDFGAAAQAGFGIGGRLMQAMFLPVMSIAFAAAPLAGQNFGARNAARVRETFRSAAFLVTGIMIVITALSHIAPEAMIRGFSQDPAVIAFGAEYLRIISFNFVAAGLVFTSSSIFQGMGHTVPPLVCSTLRIVVFALPAYLLSLRSGFQIDEVWYLSVTTVTLQAVGVILLLLREFKTRLVFAPLPAGTTALVPAGAATAPDAEPLPGWTPTTPAPEVD
jgi:putative MATE family efflux protein